MEVKLDRERMIIVWTEYTGRIDPRDAECELVIAHTLPAKFDICSRCDGRGTHDPAWLDHGITAGEWGNWDDEARARYMSGAYDVRCARCGGEHVEMVPDESRCDAKTLSAYYGEIADEQRERAGIRHTTMMENGGRW